MRINVLILLAILFLSSCVPGRLYDEMKAKKAICETENGELKARNLELDTRYNDMQSRVRELEARITSLGRDTGAVGSDYRRLQEMHRLLNETYDRLLKSGTQTAADQEASRQLIRDLQKTQENLQKKEDELRDKERMLTATQDSINALGGVLVKKDSRLAELESMLSAKDSAVRALKNTLSNALVGFKDKGLSVEHKNGKVYVMLEERLLFATGSTVVDPNGVLALKELGKVLEKNPDISIMVEGHTDDVPMKGSGDIKDNWDLSVMRATSVTRIILSNAKITPLRITASGKGEFAPADPGKTSEARKKNRRIEIILTPKLDEILKVLETN